MIGGLPILLLFIGGALGGILGVAGSMLNFAVFRQDGRSVIKYLKVIGIGILTYVLYVIIAALLINAMQ